MPDDDAARMAEAVSLARRGEGLTRPNPPVGAVVVREGEVVGRGWHPGAGEPHAEVFALREAGERSRGATLYVTLEPCSTRGRTPPCTDAILAAGVERVVGGVSDPNPNHRGKGWAVLREGGVEVMTGIGEEACRALLEPFARVQTCGRPFVTLKMACSLDGRIADASGASKWITGSDARERVQALRRRADVMLVGAETVRRDAPSLLPRPDHGRRPWRVVLSRRGEMPATSPLFTDACAGQTRILTAEALDAGSRDVLERGGARVETLTDVDAKGHLHLDTVLRYCASTLGGLHVVCEGGGGLAGRLLREKLVDEVWWFIAPCLLGGDAIPAVRGAGWALPDAPRLRLLECVPCGKDVLIRARPDKETESLCLQD